MFDSFKLARIRQAIERLASDDSLEALPSSANEAARAAEEGLNFESVRLRPPPFNAADAYQSAASKITQRRFDALTTDELLATEAIILPKLRPVTFVCGGTYRDLPQPWAHLNIEATRRILAAVLPSVGRIDLPGHRSYPYGGTGFVVGGDLLMTNRHVAKIFCDGIGEQELRYTAGAAVDFKREVDSPPDDRSARFVVRSVEMIHPYWDMALLRVEGLSASHEPLPLSTRPYAELVGREIVLIGYPARDDRNDLAEQDRIFEMTYNVKRLQPGKLLPSRRVRSFANVVEAMAHDASTLGGSSGSALVDVESGEVVGLHFAGVYLDANFGVPLQQLARDAKVTRRALSFTKRLEPSPDWDAAWSAAADPKAQSPAPPAPGSEARAIDLRLTIAPDGQVRLISAGGCAAPEYAEGLKIPFIADGLEARGGYSSKFLAPAVAHLAMPALTPKGREVAAKLDDGSVELKYHKFSVVMHKGRRLALFTAANVDWRTEQRLVGGKKPTRRQLTGLDEGSSEKWVTDWRISQDHQLPDIFFTKDGGAWDKGHLVRREDVCWGADLDDIRIANGDTFHTTNCSPQTARFNQASKGTENWGRLEMLVQEQTRAEKAIIFCGPVFDAADPLFDGAGLNGSTILLRIPRKFWKIVVVAANGGPQAFGFVLEQNLSGVSFREEFAVPSGWRKHVASVEEIQGLLSGLVDLSALKPFDRSESGEGARMEAAVVADAVWVN